MSLGKHSDYGSYLTDLKYSTLGKHLSEQHTANHNTSYIIQ